MKQKNLQVQNVDGIAQFLATLQFKLFQAVSVLTIVEEMVLDSEETPEEMIDRVLALTSLLKLSLDERAAESLEFSDSLMSSKSKEKTHA